MTAIDWPTIRRILLKAILLLIILNLLFGVVDGRSLLGLFSLYNRLFPGRSRLPYGDDPETSYNITLTDLDAMFAAHEIESVADNEFRIFLIGDSSIWGFLQPTDETVSASLNTLQLHTSDGTPVRVYNLAYPTMSWLKDLLILDYAMRYEPDLIVWFVTLESGMISRQMDAPLVQYNADEAVALIERYHLAQDMDDPRLIFPTFWDRTIIGARKPLADLLRHQFYGVLWSATGIDQTLPESYTARMEDLPADPSFQGLLEAEWDDGVVAMDVLHAGLSRAGDVPIILVNEPVFRSSGENSDIRYNFYYPRWAYDRYRTLLTSTCEEEDWRCVDFWDLLPGNLYTDSAIHYNPEGSQRVAGELLPLLMESIP